MKVLVAADDSGSMKEITCVRGTDTSVQTAPQPESVITFCEESRLTKIQQFLIHQDYIITTRAKGSICFYELNDDHKLIKKYGGCSLGDNDDFVALFESFGLIYACTEAGSLTIINPDNLESEKLSISVKGPVSTFMGHPLQRGVFAYGGKENDVKIISLFENIKDDELSNGFKINILFEAKNVKNNALDLRVPIWISKIMFLEANVKRGSWKFITVTRYGQIRKYDTTHGRKPISDIKISEKPLLTLSHTSEPSEIICSDTHTTTAKFDTEKGILLGKYKGAVGSIQALHPFLEGNIIATGGLDRYFRAFDIDSREQVAKVYIGSQISHVQVIEDDEEEEKPAPRPQRRRNSKGEDIEEEELWKKLNSEKRKIKKQKA